MLEVDFILTYYLPTSDKSTGTPECNIDSTGTPECDIDSTGTPECDIDSTGTPEWDINSTGTLLLTYYLPT